MTASSAAAMSKRRQQFRVIDAGTEPVQPPDKGRLYYDFEIPDAFLNGLPNVQDKLRWVRANLPRETRIRIGRQSAWWEADVRAYLESLRNER